MSRRYGTTLFLWSLLYFLASCASVEKGPTAVEAGAVTPDALELFAPSEELLSIKDNEASATIVLAVERQLKSWERRAKAQKNFLTEPLPYFPGRTVTRDDLRRSLLALRKIVSMNENPRILEAMLRQNFDFYRMKGKTGRGDVLITGYYHPLMRGSLKKSESYPYPLYALPEDFVSVELSQFGEALGPNYHGKKRLTARLDGKKVVPYFDRRQIDAEGSLDKRGLELVYLESDLDRFFLQIQGSGTVILPDGQHFPVYYAGQNGHAYVGVGSLLVKDGLLSKDELSMEAIRNLLGSDPELKDRYFFQNPSYVFFRKGEGEPQGSSGVELTPRRSLATDKNLFPEGAPAWVRFHRPAFDEGGRIEDWLPTSQFMLDQDSGGAIKSPGRVDLYLGSGDWAQTTAGHLAYYGEVYYVILKEESPYLHENHSDKTP